MYSILFKGVDSTIQWMIVVIIHWMVLSTIELITKKFSVYTVCACFVCE